MLFFPTTESRLRGAFSDKHVLITGSSSGIGRFAALLLARSGASLTLVARTPGRLEDAAGDARASLPEGSSARVGAIACDCADAPAVDAMLARAVGERGEVDLLINSAGGAVGTHFEDLTPEVAEAQMRMNYYSQLYPTRAVYARMKESAEGGHVVLTSSMAGLVGVFGYAAYAPAKFALRGLAEVLYYEGRPHGIEVTVCYPPDTDTPGYANEKLTMPKESSAISESAGVFTPDQVAEAMLLGVIRKQKRVMIGVEGKMLGILTAGMSPGASLAEVFLMPIMRLLSVFFVAGFNKTITKVQREKEDAGRSIAPDKAM